MATLLKTLGLGLAGAATLTLGGCYDDGYGYGGVAVGAGSVYGGGYGYDPYYDGYGYGGYGGYPAYGWYDGFYYPGTGYYVYDRGGRRQRWRDSDRRYWEGRRGNAQAGGWRGRDGVARPGVTRPGDGRWNGRRPDGQQAGQWQNNGQDRGRWRGGDRRPGKSGVGATIDRQVRGPERSQRWSERREGFRQGQTATPGAGPQRLDRQRTFTPRASGGPGGGQFRQRGSGRNPRP
jgi:hypothetical protein